MMKIKKMTKGQSEHAATAGSGRRGMGKKRGLRVRYCPQKPRRGLCTECEIN